MNKKELKQKLEKKIDTVLKQYEYNWNEEIQRREHPYIIKLKEIEKQLFSKNKDNCINAVKRLDSLLLSLRAWEDGYYDAFWDTSDKYKDKFVDGFNNWDEWYDFLKSIVEDAKKYCELSNGDKQ